MVKILKTQAEFKAALSVRVAGFLRLSCAVLAVLCFLWTGPLASSNES